MTDLLKRQGRDVTSYKCFKTFLDRDGKFFKDGAARYAIFADNRLVMEYPDSCTAERCWKTDTMDGFKLEDYKGIDYRLKN